MAAAQFFFFIIAVDLMSTANADLEEGREPILPALLRKPSGGHGHSPRVLPRGQDRTVTAALGQGWLGDASAPGGLPGSSPGEKGFPCAPGSVEPAPVQARMSPPPPALPIPKASQALGQHRDCLGILSHRGAEK